MIASNAVITTIRDCDAASVTVWSLVCGLPRNERDSRQIMALHGYIDDSGYGDHNDPAFVLSGFVASVPRWAAFSDQWREALDDGPSIKYLKMSEAAGLTGEFGNWSARKRNEKLGKLFPIIAGIKPMGIRSIIPCGSFHQNVKGKIAKTLNSPYFLALLRNGDLDVTDPAYKVDFTFDENPKLKSLIDRWYGIVMSELPAWAAGLISNNPIFRDDKQFLPLQAADSHAWLGLQLQKEKAGQRPFDRKGLDRAVFEPLERITVLEPTFSLTGNMM